MIAAPAYAQDAPAAPETAPEATAAATDDAAIVVTAQRRAENIQDVPISIAAFSGDTLEAANVVTVQDLGRIAPNFQATKGVQSSFLRLNIRGIGAAGNTTIEPSVAVFADGIYVPRAGAIVGALMDMQSVEVLRGPQGTLFGRNASVGALSLHTATPVNHFAAQLTGEIANGDRYRTEGFINAPLSDNVAVRVAGMSQWFGGYWTNARDGSQLGGVDEQAIRAALRADFGNIEWIVRGDYNHSSGDGFVNLDFDPNTVSPATLAALQTRLGGQLPDTNLNDRILNQYVTADLTDRQWGVSSTLSLDLGGGTVRLINSYRDWSNDQLDGDVIFTPLPIASRTGNYRSKSQNHELQFISPTRTWLNGHLDLVAGLYYFSEDYRLDEQLHMNSMYCNALVAAGPGRTACNSFLTTNGGQNAADQDVFQSVDSYAAYGQATLHLNDYVDFTAGGRWTRDDKSGSYAERVTNPFIVPFRAPEVLTFPDLSEERFTYRFSLDWHPNRDVMFFANYSTGYKSGGYNSGGGSPALSTFGPTGNLISTQRLFGQETVSNYELGARSTLLDHHLTANITFYRMDIAGYQDRAFDGTSFTIRNAGNLRQQGFELDLVATPTRNLTFTGSLAYLDSAFTDYHNASGLPGCGAVGAPPAAPAACTAVGLGTTQDLTGKPVTFSPEFQGRLAVDWTGDLGSTGLTWALNGNLSYISDQYIGLVTDANPQTLQDGYALLGARATLHGADDRWSVSLFGNNLTNANYSLGDLYQVLDSALGLRNSVFPGSTAIRRLHSDPRTYGVSATVRF
ncbi:MAG TPA: TonB-dependent receptor [Allosphingosinicella sp.]|nr:TonB-dependent receptor [Allosphingosinicella sp.]